MLWFVLALLGAFFDATYYALVKKGVKDMNQFVFSSGVFFTASIVLFLISFIRGFPELKPGFFSALFTTVSLNIVATYLYYKALSIEELSIAVPLLSFTPVFLLVTSSIILHEIPSPMGIAGVVLVVAGSYFINLRKGVGVLGPVKALLKNKGAIYMLAVSLIFSISSNYDKIVVTKSDPFFSSACAYLLLSLSFSAVSIFFYRNELSKIGENIQNILLAGISLPLVAVTINTAFTMQIVPYVIAVKRLSILFSIIFGAVLFGEESMPEKLAGGLLMVAGAVLIMLS